MLFLMTILGIEIIAFCLVTIAVAIGIVELAKTYNLQVTITWR